MRSSFERAARCSLGLVGAGLKSGPSLINSEIKILTTGNVESVSLEARPDECSWDAILSPGSELQRERLRFNRPFSVFPALCWLIGL